MDGILVQDSDWYRKLSLSLYDLLKKKSLCDLGIVCSAQNDVASIKSNEVVMVHRCILSAASETIKHLSVGGQVYNLVKINGVNISTQCWENVLQFVYCGRTSVDGSQLCDMRRAAHVLQIKALERAVDMHHVGYAHCVCPNKDPAVNSTNLTQTKFTVRNEKWISELFESMLDLLVKQTLCNMTIITEKGDKTSAEILAHLCMLVAASGTIRELVLQGTDTYNSVKIDSIGYNTWLYLLEYIYTSRVSIVKSNIPEVWVASQLLQIDGLANAVSPFANQINAARGIDSLPTQALLNPLQQRNAKAKHNQHPMSGNPDLSGSSVIDRESPSAAVNDENSLGLSLNSDSCDAHCTDNPLHLHANDDNSMLHDIVDSTNIKSEFATTLPDEISSISATPDVTGSVAIEGSVMNEGQLISVQSGAAGADATQTSSQIVQGMGQWIQTMGLDGATPTMLWLPQGMIPVMQTATQTAAQSHGDSPPKSTSPLQNSSAISTVSNNYNSPESVQAAATNSNKTPTKNFLYFCRKCERVFSQSSYLEKHKCNNVLQLKTVSSSLGSDENTSPNHPSSVLQSEAISSTKSSVRNCTANNKLQCKFCYKVFSRTWTLNVHMRTHTGERPYKCNVCGKAFSDKSNMRQHTLIHTEERQYKCPSCNQAFAQKRYMRKHYAETCRRKGDGELPVDKDEQNVDTEEVTTVVSPKSKRVPPSNVVIYLAQPETSSAVSPKTVKTEAQENIQTSEESKWNTSIIMQGDDTTVEGHEGTDVGPEESESAEHGNPLMCGDCNKRFKTQRQAKSHRCRYD